MVCSSCSTANPEFNTSCSVCGKALTSAPSGNPDVNSRRKSPYSWKPLLYFGIGAVCVIVAATGIVNVLTNPTRLLRKGIEAGDVASVNSYIDQHLNQPEEKERFLLALNAALDAQLKGVTMHFEDLLLQRKLNPELQVKVLQAFASRRQEFSKPEALLNLLLKQDEKKDSLQAMADVLRLLPPEERLKLIAAHLPDSIDAHSQSPAAELHSVLEVGSAVLPESKDVFANIRSLDDARYTAASEDSEIESKTASNQDDIISYTASQAKKPYWISGYIVGMHSYGIYEIAFGYGSNHALLFATKTQFTTKGAFSMLVQEGGEIPETLKEEYGGFVQMWKIYTECEETCKNNLEEAKQKVKELHQENTTLRARSVTVKATLRDTTANLNHTICTFKQNCTETAANDSAVPRAESAVATPAPQDVSERVTQ